METKKDLEEIEGYAKQFYLPITDIKNFNKLLKQNGVIQENQFVKRETLRKLLRY